MKRAEKEKTVEDLSQAFTQAQAFFITDFRGLKVKNLTELRFELKKCQSDFKVVKNRLALRALEPEIAKSLEEHFDSTTSVAISYGDFVSVAKALKEFSKANKALQIKGGFVEGKVVSPEEVNRLAELPSREELLAKLLATWEAVPTNFVRALHAVPTKWAHLLEAIRKKKEEAGE